VGLNAVAKLGSGSPDEFKKTEKDSFNLRPTIVLLGELMETTFCI